MKLLFREDNSYCRNAIKPVPMRDKPPPPNIAQNVFWWMSQEQEKIWEKVKLFWYQYVKSS